MSQSSDGGDDRTRFDGLGSAEMIRINRYCDQFESVWQKSGNASLKDFLACVDEADWNNALPELVQIDLAYRQKLDLPISAKMYLVEGWAINRNWLDNQLKLHQSAPAKTVRVAMPGEPTQLGDYRIDGKLGAGGMGQVYRATHKLMGRVVAIKVLKESRLTDLAARRRFEREVRTISKLSHPNIVSAFDAREENGMLFLVTEYVDGEDFSILVARKGPLKPVEAMHLIWQAAKGLKYAHGEGIIHRDIKPGNLLLEKKRTVKVLDLGLARLLDRGNPEDTFAEELTKSDHIVGTASYMSPEQARSPLAADERSDIYSLGCTLFFLLTGNAPYRGETYVDTLLAHIESPTPDLPAQARGVSIDPELRALTSRMIAKSPDQRPQTMDEIVNSLAAILKKRPAETTASIDFSRTGTGISPVVPGRKNDSRKRPLVFLAVLSLATLVVALFVWSRFWPAGTSNSRPGPTDNGNSTPVVQTNGTSQSGLRFDGVRSYVQVTGFESPPAGALRIEVAAIPSWQNRPSNLVSWTGSQSLTLFTGDGGQWGIAFFDGERSHLIVSQEPIQYDRFALIAGEWTGIGLRLFVNGNPISTQSVKYGLGPANSGLFIGGVPEDFLQPGEVRYFSGSIHGVRISAGELTPPAKNLDELFQLNDAALAVFPFAEGTGGNTLDLSNRRWQGVIHNSAWTNVAVE